MAFTTKDWRDSPDTSTPLTAAALEDLESRLGAYADLLAVNVELGYAAMETNATNATTTATDLPGLSLSFTVGARPVIVLFDAAIVSNGTAGARVSVSITDAANALKRAGAWTSQVANQPGAIHMLERIPAGAGAVTRKARLASSVGGATATVSGDPSWPATLHAVQV